METHSENAEQFDETQSLRVIHEMIQVSHKKLKNDGILFILWGWLMFYNYTSNFIFLNLVITYQIQKILEYSRIAMGILAIGFSIYYILKQRKKVQTYIGISLRYVWISLICCLSFTSIIMHNVLHQSNLELQHPLFMLFIAFSIVITGGILRYRMIIFGGIAFALLALASSCLQFDEQMLLEAIAWLIAFIIPGHILFAKRNK